MNLQLFPRENHFPQVLHSILPPYYIHHGAPPYSLRVSIRPVLDINQIRFDLLSVLTPINDFLKYAIFLQLKKTVKMIFWM